MMIMYGSKKHIVDRDTVVLVTEANSTLQRKNSVMRCAGDKPDVMVGAALPIASCSTT